MPSWLDIPPADPKTRLGRLRIYAPLVTEIATVYGERPSRVLALGYRESWLGYAPGYSPKGDPTGTGDGGNGCGIFQIDKRYHAEFVNSEKFKDPAEQCRFACGLLQANRHALIKAGTFSERGVYAAYNASLSRVLFLLKNGKDPDGCTTGKNYSQYVFTLADAIESSYPSLVGR